MSLKYIPEYARAALLALDLAHKKAHHLRYGQGRDTLPVKFRISS